MATIKQVANKIGKDLNESYPNIQNLFDVLKRGFKDMENVSGGGGGGSEVDWTQLQASGTKIAEIEIDGDKTNVYAPASQTIAVSQIQTTGTKIASISLDGVSTDLYAPNGGGSAPSLIASSTADGVKTYGAMLTEIASHLTDVNPIGSVLVMGGNIYQCLNSTYFIYFSITNNSAGSYINYVNVQSGTWETNTFPISGSPSYASNTSTVPSAGYKIELYSY